MSEIRVLTASDVRTALPMHAAIDAMRDAFTQLAAGEVEVPLRTRIELPERDAVTLVMPGRAPVPFGLGAKLVSVFPQNPQVGLALIHSALILMEPETGCVAVVLEGGSLTALRTGAASGLATDILARRDARRVAIIGSGVQARAQLEAVCCVREIERVSVYSPDARHAERFAEEMTGKNGVPDAVGVAFSASQAVSAAHVICAATNSVSPVLAAGDVSPGAHVNGIGSFRVDMRELDPELLGRALVVVDRREAALSEAGEVIEAVERGLVAEDELVELGYLVTGAVAGRTSHDQITVFKSVGLAVQDLVAGARAVERAERAGLGVVVDF
ncbi:MAG: ornithine cyclodeaminase family protein [Gemmatimonadales bacterium]